MQIKEPVGTPALFYCKQKLNVSCIYALKNVRLNGRLFHLNFFKDINIH